MARKRKKKEKLSTKEKLEIINNDPELWLLNFAKILDNKNEMIPFKLNAEQRDFVKNMGKFNIILKARQLGFSTLSLGLMLFYAYQIPNSNYLMACHDEKSLQNLFHRLKMMQKSIPDAIKLKELRSNRNELLLENGSRISVAVFNENIGRSYTLQMAHVSELAMVKSDEVKQMGLLALESSLAKNPDSCIIIESTANGYDFYQKLWQSAERGRSKYKPFFYSWTNRSHLEQFRSEIDEAVEWYKSINKGLRLTSDPLELTPYERKLLKETKVTLNQLMWRQFKMQDMKDVFVVDFPAFPSEAFLSTNTGVFDANIINERMNYLPEPLKQVEGLPLILQKYIGNGLNIYEQPKPKEKYFGGIDVASGLGGNSDNSSICILDSSGEQVVSFARNDLPVYKLVDVVIQLGYFYNYTMYLVERNSYGLDLIHRLTKEKNYIQVLKTKRFDKIKGRKIWEYGYYTDSVSKTKLVSTGKQAVEEGLILVNDRETLEEMKIYQENKGSFGNIAGEGNFDDRVDSLMLSVICLSMGRYYI